MRSDTVPLDISDTEREMKRSFLKKLVLVRQDWRHSESYLMVGFISLIILLCGIFFLQINIEKFIDGEIIPSGLKALFNLYALLLILAGSTGIAGCIVIIVRKTFF